MYRKLLPVILALLLVSCGSASDSPTLSTRIVSPEATDVLTYTPSERIDEATLPIPEPVETARISFLAAGDNVIHPCIYIDAKRRADESTREYNFKPMYADVADFIAGFDLAFINQETLMGGAELGYSGYPNFNSPQDLGLDLIELGFDIVSIANNHMCDKGVKGLAGTIDFWKSQDIMMIGGYENAEDYETPRIIELEGIKIALLSYTYGTNGHTLPASSELVVPYIDDETIVRQCAAANEAADFVIVSVHWGNENQYEPSEEQKHTAKLLAENGVDVIIGHHPHVLQPIEWIETDAGETLCIYSLGNLVSAMQYWQNMVGGFFTFDIVVMSDGEVYADSPQFVPTAFYYGPSYYNSHLYFLSDYPADVAATHGTKNLYNSSATPDDMKRFAEKIMGEYISYQK